MTNPVLAARQQRRAAIAVATKIAAQDDKVFIGRVSTLLIYGFI